MSRPPRRHRVHGRLLTVSQAAAELGLSRTAMRARMERRGSLEAAWDQGPDQVHRLHPVYNQVMTVPEMARRLGVSKNALYMWQRRHPGASMEDMWDFYSDVKHGRRPLRQKKPRLHPVPGGRQLSVAQAAQELGVSVNAVRVTMSTRGLTLAEAWELYDRRRTERAVKEILGIIGGKE